MARITKTQRIEQQLRLTQHAASLAATKLQIIEAIARGGVKALQVERALSGVNDVRTLRITIELLDDGSLPDVQL